MSERQALKTTLVVGAGPTGLILALTLAQRKLPVRIIDRKPGPGITSRAIAVHARTLELYQQLGIVDDILADGIPAKAGHIVREGKEAATFSFGDMGLGRSPYPYVLLYPQDVHERLLIRKLEDYGVRVEWNVELVDVKEDEEEDKVHAVLRQDGSEELSNFAYLCGCDGAHSAGRNSLGISFDGTTFEQPLYVADVKITESRNDDAYASFDDAFITLALPVRSGTHRLIGMVPREFAKQSTVDIEIVRPLAKRMLGVHVEKVNWFSTYQVHHRVAEKFHVGHCFLVGDAAHIHSPVGGQGMNTGIGDAINLGWKIAHVLQDRANSSILDTYETERLPFAQRLVSSTDRVFEEIIGQGLRGRFLRSWAAPYLISFLTNFSITRGAVFNIVSQLRIAYPNSDLSAGKAGYICGGVRLPWVKDGKTDNFDPLRSCDWQLHIYGMEQQALTDIAKGLDLNSNIFPWSDNARRAGLFENGAYLVRPDGYVALALPDQDAIELQGFVERLGLRFSTLSNL